MSMRTGISENEMLMARGLESLRKIRSKVTEPGSDSKERMFGKALNLLSTMETLMILSSRKDRSKARQALEEVLYFELMETHLELTDVTPVSVWGLADPLDACWSVYTQTKEVLGDHLLAIATLMSRNGLYTGTGELFCPETLVISPLSTDRFMWGTVRRILVSQEIPCFDLATAAMSTDLQVIVYSEDEWQRMRVRDRQNIYILNDAVQTGETSEALHNFLEPRTMGNLHSAVRRTIRTQLH